jgi:5-methylcytosine-specific restriction protein A
MAVKCMAPSCKVIVRDVGKNRCPKHEQTQKDDKNERRQINRKVANKDTIAHDPFNKKFYQSPQWRRLSVKQRTLFPFCKHCEDEGRMKVADVADHIIEINDGGSKASMKNLQSLCNACHMVKTKAEIKTRKTSHFKTNENGDILV